MLQNNAGYAPILWDRRPVDRAAVLPLAAAFVSVLAGCVITAELTRWGGGHPVIQPSAGILLIFVALSRSRLTPYYLLVALAAEACFAVFSSVPLYDLFQGVADAGEVGLFVVLYLRFQHKVVRYERLTRFLVGIILSSAVCPAIGAVGVAASAAVLLHLPFSDTWSTRFRGDALGIISFVPQIIAVLSGDLLRAPQRRAMLLTLALSAIGLLLTIYLMLLSALPLRFLILFLFMLLSTIVLPVAEAFLVVLVVILTMIIGTMGFHVAAVSGRDLLLDQRVASLQVFVATAVLTIMPVAIILHERDKLAVEAKTAREEAERANRSKSDFLAAISHEIRNPLSAILGLATSLQATQLSAEQRRLLTLVQDAGHAVIAVTNDILDIARAERGLFAIKPAPFSIASLVDSLASLIRPHAEAKGLAILVEQATVLPAWAMGDAARLRQILLNLVSNAIKFTQQGTITIIVRPGINPRLFHFEVIDTGTGLTDSEQARLFVPFVRIENEATRLTAGTGLGLALSKRLIEAMPGGKIGVFSNEGAGTTFWFSLELPECAPPKEVKHVAFDDILPPRSLEILVAEDYVVNQMIITAILERAGHSVTVVENGRQAVDAIGNRHFDIVLMDMEMPVMNGLDATRAIRARIDSDHAIPIIALTAHAMSREVEACLSAGMNGHLVKPFDNVELLRQIQQLTERQPA